MNGFGRSTRYASVFLSVLVISICVPRQAYPGDPIPANKLEKELIGATKDEVSDRLGIPRYNRTHLDDPTGNWYYSLHEDPLDGVEVVDPATGKKCCEINILFKDRRVVAVTFGY